LGDPSVTPSVDDMSYQRLPYDDASTTTQMASDCAEVDRALQFTDHAHRGFPAQSAHSVQDGHYDTVQVSDDLAQVAAGLQLHFD
jgi:hypothetical protein